MLTDINRPRVKEIRPTPGLRGFLYFGDPKDVNYLSISVNMYLHVKDVKRPCAFRKYSTLSKGPTNGVQHEKKYFVGTPNDSNEHAKQVERLELEKAYRFGTRSVKVTEEDVIFSKLKTQKGLFVLEIVPRDSVPRYYLTSNSYLLTAGTYATDQAGATIAALAQRFHEMDKVGIARYVYKDGGSARLGVLFPFFDNKLRLLQFVEVPYIGDIKRTVFPVKPKQDINVEEEKLLEEMIRSVYLNELNEAGEHYLDPKNTYSPTFWKQSQLIKDRAMNPNCPFPKMPHYFDAQMKVHESFRETLDRIGVKISSQFDLKKEEEEKEEEEEIKKMVPINDLIFRNKLEKIQRSSDTKTLEISSNTPVEDFK
ncbi:hypothetical protein G6F56_010012 [Rhizopus delemar]|nr:hypothetical protein G6F56_010012 [Rhizopus delemar]